MVDAVRVIDTVAACPEIPIVRGGGNSRVVLWPGNGARYRSFHLISLDGGSGTVDLGHASDCVYYVLGGEGLVLDLTSNREDALVEGAMVHIDAGDRYRLEAGEAGMRVLGGPCPPDEALYAQLRGAGDML